jgi:hypothetical protein
MPVYKIEGAVADKYHGCGQALAAVAGGQLVDIVYLRDVIDEIDEEDETSVRQALDSEELGPTVRYLSAIGEVFVGMCSCYEFVVQ